MKSLPQLDVVSTTPCIEGVSLEICDSASWAAGQDLSDLPLCNEDHQRAARLRDASAAVRLLASLASAKVMLGILLDVSPFDVSLGHHEEGAPYLCDWPDRPVSISRSEGWTAVGSSDGRGIGIDIELVRPLGWKPMLPMICGPEEQASLLEYAANEPDGALFRFFRAWTVKEAVLKATGRGFRAGAASIVVPAAVLTGPPSAGHALTAFGREFVLQSWQFGDLIVSAALEAQA